MLKNVAITNTIKLLIYKELPNLLENLNYEDDFIFSEPLLFAYFNTKKNKTLPKELLEEIMQGYFTDKVPLKINYSFGKSERTYLPLLGYYNKLDTKIQECYIIKDTKIELLYQSFELLDTVFEIASEDRTAKK